VSPSRRSSTAGSQVALRVTQVRSSISAKPKHRGTLRALGLRGVGRSRVLPDRPEIRGMLARVPHLVEVEPATAEDLSVEQARAGAVRAEHRAAERAADGASREETRA
jgi:large subunit ribosomal protein L30